MSTTMPARKTVSPTLGPKKATTSAAKPAQSSAKKVPALPAESAAAPMTPAAKTKQKLVRDSFTIPKSEYGVLEGLKARAAQLTRPVKKGELLRAGIIALHKMTDKAFLAAIDDVPSLKTGRPKAPETTIDAPNAPKAV